jgi:hypothetical protein
MRIKAPLESPDHAIVSVEARRTFAALCVLAIVLGAGGAPEALAQGGPCTAIEDDAERLACYDRALRPAPAASPAPAPRAAPTPAPAPPAAASAPVPDAGDSRRERRVRESTAAPAPAPAPARAAPPAPAAGAPADEAIVPIVVVGMRALPGRETTFTTNDGAMWVQTDSQRLVSMPDTPFNAEIRPGAMGSYFLVPSDRGRAIRVRRADSR